jgi:hypothetical protein
VVVVWIGPPPQERSRFTAGFDREDGLLRLNQPTAVRFASDGRVFVAEKGGLIKGVRVPDDTTPANLRRPAHQVHNYWIAAF